MYFTEDGDGTQDIHARGTNTNGDYKFFTIIQGYSSTETVGLTFSLDNKYMYFAHQKNSEIWQIWRDDGCSFGNGIYMDVNYHVTIARYSIRFWLLHSCCTVVIVVNSIQQFSSELA